MKNFQPTISQILFSLTFLISLRFLFTGLTVFLFYYLFFHWLWLTFMAYSSSRHRLADTRGKKMTSTNIYVSIFCSATWLLLSTVLMFLSASLGLRLIFEANHLYQITIGLGLIIWLLSVIGHIVVIIRNLRKIIPDVSTPYIILRLLLYPLGIWTIQAEIQRPVKIDD